MPLAPTNIDKQQAIALERQLATYANMMDSLVRIPFTKQGVGVDAAVGTIPIVGDVLGLALTSYAVYKAYQLGVSTRKLWPVVRLALVDLGVGFIPVVGDIADIFIRPNQKALQTVRSHVQEQYGVEETSHVDHPILHLKLQEKQQHSALWRHKWVAWSWLHIPDFVGVLVIAFFAISLWTIGHWLFTLF